MITGNITLTIKEILQVMQDMEPAMLYYAGTPTGDALQKVFDFFAAILNLNGVQIEGGDIW